jgi:REP-associated tyrosine transposase
MPGWSGRSRHRLTSIVRYLDEGIQVAATRLAIIRGSPYSRCMRRRANPQLSLALPARSGWGGCRPGAGRKPGPRPPVPHARRPAFAATHPAHVTLRLRPGLPSLRSPRLVRVFEHSLLRAAVRPDFRLIHYSLQSNHAHLVVEAADRTALGRGMKALGTRLARAVHRAFGRRGPVLAERYHLRVLRTPREVRTVLRYVLLNARRHAGRVGGCRLDPASSARWFDGWVKTVRAPSGPVPVARARTWLLRIGWRRHGPIASDDVPGPRHA